jgi:hypothetical protein
MWLTILEFCAFLAGLRFLTSRNEGGRFLEVHRGIVRCFHAKKQIVLEVNFRIVLGDLSLSLQWDPSTTALLGRLANSRGKILIVATDDLVAVSDSDTTVRLPVRNPKKLVPHLTTSSIETRTGVDFTAPVFAARVDAFVKSWASRTHQNDRHGLLQFYIREGNLELEIHEVSPNAPVISRTLEPAKPIKDCMETGFNIAARHFQGVPVGSVVAAYRMNRPDFLQWEISGDICANPLVTFRILGASPLREP